MRRRSLLKALFAGFTAAAAGPARAESQTAQGLPAQSLPRADRIVVIKHERKLYLQLAGRTLKWYWIALGREPVGAKTQVGDGRTPEGFYFIEGRDPDSDFYRSLRISYPNAKDRERARQLGVDPGGGIVIHALPPGYGPTGAGERMIDWTEGCIAVTNADMDEIWQMVREGTLVLIIP